jgi:hypothetical protein
MKITRGKANPKMVNGIWKKKFARAAWSRKLEQEENTSETTSFRKRFCNCLGNHPDAS